MSRIKSEDDVDAVARLCHQVNKAYCQAMGDNSQPEWEDLRPDMKQSVRAGVRAILSNPTMSPEQSHAAWMEHKRREGWTWGPTKDVINKTHPNFRPYFELSKEEKAKDHIFGAVVKHCSIFGVPGVML